MWRGGTKILPCDPNKTQSSPDIVAGSSTVQILGQCFSQVLVHAEGNAVMHTGTAPC